MDAGQLTYGGLLVGGIYIHLICRTFAPAVRVVEPTSTAPFATMVSAPHRYDLGGLTHRWFSFPWSYQLMLHLAQRRCEGVAICS